MNTDFDWDLPYPSQKQPLLAENVVATSQPLAAQAGLQMMQQGGNAVDAAIATAIALTVVEPTSNGIGGDAFCLLFDGTDWQGLNASGKSPKAWTAEHFTDRTSMPDRGWNSVTVPGCVQGWVDLSRRFGRLAFADLFEPAIRYAGDGFLLSPMVARQWAAQSQKLKQQPGFAETFMPYGSAPTVSERFINACQAQTLQEIAETEGESFYRGNLAQKLIDHATLNGGTMHLDDLAEHKSLWVEPISQRYRDLQLMELPPNGQGIAALMAMGMLDHFDIAQFAVDSVESQHLQIEAMKLALSDLYHYVSDPASMATTPQQLLDKSYLAKRARLIDLNKAGNPQYGTPQSAGTVYLTAADASGMMVSFIQSNYMGFGSGVVVPGTGISLHNRAAGFSLKEGHVNQVAGGKRPFHTIIPGFVSKNDQPLMSFGVMGGPMQAQGHVQVLSRLADYRQNPQAISDAPRWRVNPDANLLLEHSGSQQLLTGLAEKGHRVNRAEPASMAFGRAQMIYRLEAGYLAASDHRADGQAVGF